MIFGYDFYHVLLWFLAYSMLGWLVESIYMSICNRKLTNRGFARGPICPIYGVGALTVFLHKFVEGIVNGIPMIAGKALGGFLAVLFALDFANAFYREKREVLPEQFIRIREGILQRFSK